VRGERGTHIYRARRFGDSAQDHDTDSRRYVNSARSRVVVWLCWEGPGNLMINRDDEFLGAGVSKLSVSYPKAFCFMFRGNISLYI
jgi:hypothetical protein